MEVLWKLDVPAVEQVIAVPLISLDRVPERSATLRPQKAEQLVEVPTEPGYPLAVLAVRALGRRGATALAEQIFDIPVPQGRRKRKVFSHDRIHQRMWNVEQIVDVPARGGLQGFLPGQGSSSSRFLQDEDEGSQGGSRTFPQPKTLRRLPASRVPEFPPVAAYPR